MYAGTAVVLLVVAIGLGRRLGSRRVSRANAMRRPSGDHIECLRQQLREDLRA
jgi:hypothetical protein